MNTYTIAIECPRASLNQSVLASFHQPQRNVWIIWDGPATKSEAIESASRLVDHAGRVMVFRGSDIGHLVAEWINGRMSVAR